MTPRSLPHLALSSHAHNRLGLQRTDQEWLDAAWADASTRVLLVSDARIRPVDGTLAWVSPDQAPPGRRVLLGEADGIVHFAVLVDGAEAPGAPEEWVPLRAVLGALVEAGAQGPFGFHAVGMAEWHRSTVFCPRCGGDLASRAAGHELFCAGCGRAQFPRTDPAVIMAITSGEPGSPDEALLLGRNAAWPVGRWSTLAGFCEPGETLEDAVRREVAEEVGVRVGEVNYFGNQPWPLPSSLMLGFTGRAETRDIDVDGAEIAEARWWTRAEFAAAVADGTLVAPGGVSISSSLIESWYGSPLTTSW